MKKWIAAFTLVGSVLLAWRAVSQTASLDDDGLVLRNLSSTARVHWSAIDGLRVQRRLGVQTVDVQLRGSRRTLRIGAATRFEGPAAAAVLAALERHPDAAALLDDDPP